MSKVKKYRVSKYENNKFLYNVLKNIPETEAKKTEKFLNEFNKVDSVVYKLEEV